MLIQMMHENASGSSVEITVIRCILRLYLITSDVSMAPTKLAKPLLS